jgi:hypothetical protein
MLGAIGMAGFGGASQSAAPELRAATDPAGKADPARGNASATRAAIDAIFNSAIRGIRSRDRKPGPGWSNRHVVRMARKRRNQARNRRAHR